ncbi:hypothetical protein HGRIS_012442 [Hohenbuehelia grisea]|uniref:Uncharacterized protein n=1 Tax=Hohenbuehelia grisea TaxID=104357 RepID=A0ABR3IS95_9AGAR
MDTYTLTAPSPPGDVPTGLTSLTFKVPLSAETEAQVVNNYNGFRTPEVRALQGEAYHTACSALALRAYEVGQAERATWIHDCDDALSKVASANKDTLKHVELILPTRGIAEPVDLFNSLGQLRLESFAIQWPYRQIFPMNLLPATHLSPIYASFMQSLKEFLECQSSTLKRLRISLPQYTMQEPRSYLAITRDSLPSLPHLQLLDLTHTGPELSAIASWLQPDTPFAALEHLILDQGSEISSSADVSCDSDDEDDNPNTETGSTGALPGWQTLGYLIAIQRLEGRRQLKSLSAALHETRVHFGGASRVQVSSLKQWLQEGAQSALKEKKVREGDKDPLEDLVVVTAWPQIYDLVEPHTEDDDEDSYTHIAGYGHLAYPENQRPTTGLWPAKIPELMSWNEQEAYY